MLHSCKQLCSCLTALAAAWSWAQTACQCWWVDSGGRVPDDITCPPPLLLLSFKLGCMWVQRLSCRHVRPLSGNLPKLPCGGRISANRINLPLPRRTQRSHFLGISKCFHSPAEVRRSCSLAFCMSHGQLPGQLPAEVQLRHSGPHASCSTCTSGHTIKSACDFRSMQQGFLAGRCAPASTMRCPPAHAHAVHAEPACRMRPIACRLRLRLASLWPRP